MEVGSREDDMSGLLSVLQLSDSAFPTGRYTLSHGLEAYATSGAFPPRPAAALSELLLDTIRGAVARSDGAALACAHRAVISDGELDLSLACAADRRLSAVKLVREARVASQRTGRALAVSANALRAGGRVHPLFLERMRSRETPGNHAVVLGLVSAGLGVSARHAVAGDLHAFCVGWASAAVRLSLIDHRGAQRLISSAGPTVAQAARRAVSAAVDDISACAPMADLMSMCHERADVRLFST